MWLPDKTNPLIESEIIPHLELATVYSLKISENGDWDIDLVKYLFNERDQKLIFSVPLSQWERNDEWMWGEERNEKDSVKDWYKVKRSVGNSNPIISPINWKIIWKLKVQPRIHNFLWRSFSSCLPNLTALNGHKVEVVEWCPLCHHSAEDDFHALVSCPYSRNVWSLSPVESHISPFQSLS